MNPRRIATQTIKELRQFRRDRLSVGLAFVLPALMLLIFGFGIRLESHDIPIAVGDEDNTTASRAISERLFSTNVFRAVPLVRRAGEDAQTATLDRGSADATIVIPSGYERAMLAGHPLPLQVTIDGSDVVNARVIRNELLGTVSAYNAMGAVVIRPIVRIWFNPGRREALFIIPGIYAIVIGIFPALLAAIAAVRDREEGTILQVYASSVGASEYLLGKTFAYTLVGLAEASAVMLLGALIWGVLPVGDASPLLVCTPLYCFTVVALGIAVGSRTTTQSAAVQAIATVSNLPSVLLTGFLYPISNIPWPLNLLSYVIPARYFIDVSRDAFVRGSGWDGVVAAPLALALLAIVFLAVARRSLGAMRLSG
jgi:ABC-2 type transport system permease protein